LEIVNIGKSHKQRVQEPGNSLTKQILIVDK